MDQVLIKEIIGFGISGLFAFMWWTERRDRLRADEAFRDASRREQGYIQIITDNTKAMSKLTETLEQFTQTLKGK